MRHDKGSPWSIAQEKTQSDVKGQVNLSQALDDWLHIPGVEASGDRSHKVAQLDDPRQEKPGKALGDRLHFLGFTRNSSPSVRNEFHNPSVQASASKDRLRSKEDDGMTNMLFRRVKLLQKLVTMNTDLTNFPDNTATGRTFARDLM